MSIWVIPQNYSDFNKIKFRIMDIKEFIENFAAQFDDTEAEAFTAETNFRELEEWSSLIALSIIAMVDEEYDVTLKGDDMRAANTIQELFDIVNAKK